MTSSFVDHLLSRIQATAELQDEFLDRINAQLPHLPIRVNEDIFEEHLSSMHADIPPTDDPEACAQYEELTTRRERAGAAMIPYAFACSALDNILSKDPTGTQDPNFLPQRNHDLMNAETALLAALWDEEKLHKLKEDLAKQLYDPAASANITFNATSAKRFVHDLCSMAEQVKADVLGLNHGRKI